MVQGNLDQSEVYKRRKPYNFRCKAFIKKGGDLLSHFRSTIGAEELNCSVRYGKRWDLLAINTYSFCRIGHISLVPIILLVKQKQEGENII